MIDISRKQDVKYSIPTWLRDEQIKLALPRVKGRLEPEARKHNAVAVVGYGPSLNDTWEKIREFKYVISCSGAHPFLIERGIIPNWHVAVDPLPRNTVRLIGTPHPDVEYLIASTCHQDVFDHLEGHNVKLWHVFTNEEEGYRILPYGEWAVLGGCDVGLRALTIAALLGFTKIHVFGLDGSYGSSGRHAGDHPSKKQQGVECPYGGTMYYTTPAMAEAARQVAHELDQMPAVTATFYGSGLIQHMMKDYRRSLGAAGNYTNVIGIRKEPLISEEYRELNARLHRENLAYGVGGGKHAPVVEKLVGEMSKTLNRTPSVLDYGCGKGYLQKALPFPIWEYDPVIPAKAATPRPADIVVCTDVLEHIEPELLHGVLMDLKRVMNLVGYFVIHTGPSSKQLADGRNAHLLQRDRAFWEAKLGKYFKIGRIEEALPLLRIMVGIQTEDGKKKPAITKHRAEVPPIEQGGLAPVPFLLEGAFQRP